MSRGQLGFLVLVALPVILGLVIYNAEFKMNYREGPPPDRLTSWNPWHAYQHEWCYLVAGAIWFAAIWMFLADRKKS